MAIRLLLYRSAFVAGLATLTTLCLVPMPSSEGGYMDKVYHGVAYLILSILGMLGIPGLPTRPKIIGGLIAWGVMVEFLQIPAGRSFELADMLANSLGVGVGLLFITLTGLGRGLPPTGAPAAANAGSSTLPPVA